MAKLTPEEAKQIAGQLTALARVVQKYRLNHMATLPGDTQERLAGVEADLRRTSNKYADEGLDAALDNAQDSIDSLSAITKKLTDDEKHLDAIAKDLNKIATLAQVAAAFTTGNPATIVAALASATTAL